MKEIICWGTGKQAKEALEYLQSEQYKILYFVDKNKDKWGKGLDGFMIKEPSSIIVNIELIEFVLITSGYWQEIFEECIKLDVCFSKIKYFDVKDFKIKCCDEIYADIVFSQDGEEIYLKQKFAEKIKGTYVDIGAFHPFRFSNTYWAYKRGWQGINIEPNIENYKLFCDLRPNDININCGISNKNGKMDYYLLKEGALNTFCFDEIKNKKDIIDIYKMEIRRLDSVFEEYGIKEVDYIDIDVEGMELEVLQSIDWNKVCIKCILLEQRRMTLLDVIHSDTYEFLKDKGYIPVCKYNRTVVYEKVFSNN